MLEVNQTILLDGKIVIDGEVVATLRGEVRDSDTVNYNNREILNQDLYDANKAKCRKLEREFQDKVWELEDANK